MHCRLYAATGSGLKSSPYFRTAQAILAFLAAIATAARQYPRRSTRCEASIGLYRWFIRTESGRLEVAKHPTFQEPSRMNTHKNARLTFARRLEMVQEITESGSSVSQAAADHGVTAPTVRKWLGRYLAVKRQEVVSRRGKSGHRRNAADGAMGTMPVVVVLPTRQGFDAMGRALVCPCVGPFA